MTYELIHELTESKLLPSKGRLKRYNLRDIADLTLLYYIGLEILSKEPSSVAWAREYARKTILFNKFDNFVYNGTDLYILLHILTGNNSATSRAMLKNDKENAELSKRLKPDLNLFRRYLLFIRMDRNDEVYVRRSLLKIQSDMDVQVQNYRSMRILAAQWPKRSEQEKRLVMTRLLQALRARAAQSEILKELEKLAKTKRLELKKVHNPEKGVSKEQKDGAPWWVQPMVSAGAAAAGYALTRRKRKD